MNVHFRSKEIGKEMIKNRDTGMLYFLYNSDLVSVLVCHDIEEGEFVLQIPYYPPIETVEYDFTFEKCLKKVK